MNIRFRIDEHKRRQHEEEELSHVEGFSGHGSMDGFRIHKIYEKQHQARKNVLELLKWVRMTINTVAFCSNTQND